MRLMKCFQRVSRIRSMTFSSSSSPRFKCVSSATMPFEAVEFLRKFMNKPIKIIIKSDELEKDDSKLFYVNVEKENRKLEALCNLCKSLAVIQSIIVCRMVDWLAEMMRNRNPTASAMHGSSFCKL